MSKPFVNLLGASDSALCLVTETVVVFLYLFALLICTAVSYGLYLFTASLFSPEFAVGMRVTRTVDLIILVLLFGGPTTCLSLGAVMFAFILIRHMASRYHSSPLVQIIASLPVVRLIP